MLNAKAIKLNVICVQGTKIMLYEVKQQKVKYSIIYSLFLHWTLNTRLTGARIQNTLVHRIEIQEYMLFSRILTQFP